MIIGSARIDEHGKATGGKAGDQKQKTTPDYKGEVSMQNFYVAKAGWYVLRAKNPDIAANIALAMTIACNNPNIGYNQAKRLDIIKDGNGTHATQPTSCDCSSLVRQCVRESGIEVGNFTTANEAQVLVATGQFTMLTYKTGTPLYLGDILVTCKKGHTAIVTSGATHSQVAVPTVKMGSRGDNARLLQHNLNQCGAKLEEDGIFGKLSTAALVRWQYANGLTADGIYGKLSHAKMKEVLT